MAKTSHDLVVEAKSKIKEVSVVDAREMIQSGAVVLDVREPGEFENGHVPGAINLPRGLLEFKLAATPELNQPDTPIVVYCKTSGRSALAVATLADMGVTNTVNMGGGYDAWAEAGYPTDKPPAIDYN
ncbi:rhodanese-like domain-containing protein [Nitrogeniibacter aestuarii]|uniref:rhodanese-like domain-containing protein n=1 Tax=Nitrogeniibacter aestuarii TaxID=2815343 RepID=UPI001E4AF830|nr:rhodanese-like domain-containing protein [Nitrogeniibacter aestuarii]